LHCQLLFAERKRCRYILPAPARPHGSPFCASSIVITDSSTFMLTVHKCRTSGTHFPPHAPTPHTAARAPPAHSHLAPPPPPLPAPPQFTTTLLMLTPALASNAGIQPHHLVWTCHCVLYTLLHGVCPLPLLLLDITKHQRPSILAHLVAFLAAYALDGASKRLVHLGCRQSNGCPVTARYYRQALRDVGMVRAFAPVPPLLI